MDLHDTDLAQLVLPALERALFPGRRRDLQAIYLFGSVAQGRTRPDSDIDIALLCEAPIDFGLLLQAAGDLEGILGRPVDLIDLRRASVVLRMQVLSRGRRIWVGDVSAAARFEMQTFSAYADFQVERAETVRAFLEPRHG